MANRYFSRFLDTLGTGLGDVEAIGDESDTDYFIQAAQGQTLAISRLIVFIEDAVTGKFDPAKYGDIAALTNGVQIQHKDADDVSICNITNGHPMKSNGHWQQVCFDVSVLENNASMALAVRWTFDRGIPQGYGQVGETPIILNNREKFCACLNDDFTGLLSHTFLVQGVELYAPAN